MQWRTEESRECNLATYALRDTFLPRWTEEVLGMNRDVWPRIDTLLGREYCTCRERIFLVITRLRGVKEMDGSGGQKMPELPIEEGSKSAGNQSESPRNVQDERMMNRITGDKKGLSVEKDSSELPKNEYSNAWNVTQLSMSSLPVPPRSALDLVVEKTVATLIDDGIAVESVARIRKKHGIFRLQSIGYDNMMISKGLIEPGSSNTPSYRCLKRRINEASNSPE